MAKTTRPVQDDYSGYVNVIPFLDLKCKFTHQMRRCLIWGLRKCVAPSVPIYWKGLSYWKCNILNGNEVFVQYQKLQIFRSRISLHSKVCTELTSPVAITLVSRPHWRGVICNTLNTLKTTTKEPISFFSVIKAVSTPWLHCKFLT